MGERGSYAPKQAAIISIQSILPGIAFTYFSSRFIKVKKQLHNRLALNKFQKYANCLKWDLELLHDELHPVQNEQDDEQDIVEAIISFCAEPKSAKEIVEKFAFPNRLYLKRHFLDEMLMKRKLKMTLPDKPSSRNQKYYS